MAIRNICMIMNNMSRVFLFVLVVIAFSLSHAMDDYSSCIQNCKRGDDFDAISISCRKKQPTYNSNICKLRNASEIFFVGQVRNVVDLHIYTNPNEDLLEFVPRNLDEDCDVDDGDVNDWKNLSKAKKISLELDIHVSLIYDEKLSDWRKKDSTIIVQANVEEGWIWNGNPSLLYHFNQIHWDDSLRIFFVKKNERKSMLVGFSKPVRSKNLDEKWMCGEASDISGIIRDAEYCKSYDPYVHSESALYKDSSNFIFYGEVDSVTLTPLTMTEKDKYFYQNKNDIEKINEKLKPLYLKRLKNLKKYKVSYMISQKAVFDVKSQRWMPEKGRVKFSAVEYEGWSIDHRSALLIQNSVDSLKNGKFVFSGHKNDDGENYIDYVSRALERAPSSVESRQLWSKKMNSGCYVRPTEIKNMSISP